VKLDDENWHCFTLPATTAIPASGTWRRRPSATSSTDLDGHVIKPSKLQQIAVKVVRK
jgi:hypothetical protein